jgi:hypothetical protein
MLMAQPAHETMILRRGSIMRLDNDLTRTRKLLCIIAYPSFLVAGSQFHPFPLAQEFANDSNPRQTPAW